MRKFEQLSYEELLNFSTSISSYIKNLSGVYRLKFEQYIKELNEELELRG